uniref:Uncharacterized protein n=1 Tax=Rousettus aegyptiacus TaxID=9407 RepID=A0A7J8ELE9_ROUAE|nr:hypothetical protein HJG63_012603 [Rousettus aegyptiacus]
MSGRRPRQRRPKEMDTAKETPDKVKMEDDGCVVIDSDSDDDLVPPKIPKLTKICSKDEILVLSDSDEPPVLKPIILEPPIVISDDDDSDVEGSVVILEDSCDKEPDSSVGEEAKELDISKSNSADDGGEQQPGGDPEATPAVSKGKTVSEGKPSTAEALEPTVEQPRKRKCKTKNTCVTPATRGDEGREAAAKSFVAEESGKCDDGLGTAS